MTQLLVLDLTEVILLERKEIQAKSTSFVFLFFSFVRSLQTNWKKMNLFNFLVGLILMGEFQVLFFITDLLSVFERSIVMDFFSFFSAVTKFWEIRDCKSIQLHS